MRAGEQPRSRGILVKTPDCRDERVVLQSFRAAGAGNPEFAGRFLGQLRRPGGKAVSLQHKCRRVEVLLVRQRAGPPRRHVALHLVEQRADLRLAEILDEARPHERRASSHRVRVGIRGSVEVGQMAGDAVGLVDVFPALRLRVGVHRFAHGLARDRILRGRPRGQRPRRRPARPARDDEVTQGCPSPLLRTRPSGGSPGRHSDRSASCDPCRAGAAAWRASHG